MTRFKIEFGAAEQRLENWYRVQVKINWRSERPNHRNNPVCFTLFSTHINNNSDKNNINITKSIDCFFRASFLHVIAVSLEYADTYVMRVCVHFVLSKALYRYTDSENLLRHWTSAVAFVQIASGAHKWKIILALTSLECLPDICLFIKEKKREFCQCTFCSALLDLLATYSISIVTVLAKVSQFG